MKRIIICTDGTWNKPGTKDRGVEVQTNVEKMFSSICPVGKELGSDRDVKQVKAYEEGVGTGYTFVDRLTGGAFGAGLDKHIKNMYTFLSLNYEKGDEIYLFGFSRGAYTARSIGGFVRNCGLLKPEYIHLVDKAYGLYRDRNDYTDPGSDMMVSWRSNFCFEDITPIEFMGVWDTVGSLGIPLVFYKSFNKAKYKFHDHTLSSYVKHAYHALAIDERRSLFGPTLWEKSKTVAASGSHVQQLEQRWFAGVHSNVGGGYKDNGLSDIALTWLIEKATAAGLCFHNPPVVQTGPNHKAELRDSYGPQYWFWGSKWRIIDPDNKKYNQVIDESVWKRYDEDPTYRPLNLASYAHRRTASGPDSGSSE